MALEKLVLLMLFMLSLSISFTESQGNESMPFFIDIHSISPSPTPQQQDGLNSSPVEIFLLPLTSSINQHIPTSSQSSNFVLQSSNNPISSLSSQASSSLSILPPKSSSMLLSTSMSVQAMTTLVSSEMIVVSTQLPTPVPSSTPIFMTPPISSIMLSLLSIAPSTMFISSPVDSSTSPSFNIEATTTVDGIPTPSRSNINSISSIVMTGNDLVFDSTSVRTLTESSIITSTTMEVISVSSILLSPTVMATTSPPTSMETTLITILRTTTEDIIEESTMTMEEEELITRSTSTVAGAGISTPAVIGMVVAACLALIATALLILVLCYCFCRSRKYEYRTGNEYRVTVQKWNAHYAHYTANQCESVSSSRGSSIMSSFGFRSSNGKMKPRLSSSTDHIHTGATAEMYSTPL